MYVYAISWSPSSILWFYPFSYIRITRHLYESFLTWAKREYFCTFWMRGTWLRGLASHRMGKYYGEQRRDTHTKKIVRHSCACFGRGWSVVHINRKHQQCGNTNNPLRTNVLWYHKSRETDRLVSKNPILFFMKSGWYQDNIGTILGQDWDAIGTQLGCNRMQSGHNQDEIGMQSGRNRDAIT